MSGAPSTPIITTRPYILPFGSFSYFFGNNPSGPTASSFTLTVNDFTSTVNSSVKKLTINNMSTSVYYSSFVVATTNDGNSLPANYRTVQFGAKPDAPSNNSGSVNNGKIILDFIPSSNDNGSQIGWYVATATETNTRFNIKNFKSTITTSTLPEGEYNFKVQAVSDAGYSDPLYYSTLTIPSAGFTYFNFASYDNDSNYYYRIYNQTSKSWSSLIDSGFNTGIYSVNDTSYVNSQYFYVIYDDGSNYYTQFVNNNGIVSTISFLNNHNWTNSYTSFFHYNQDGDNYNYGIFDYKTNNYTTSTFSVVNSYINDNWTVDNTLILAIYSNDDNLNYFYKLNPNSIPTVLFSTSNYNSRTQFNKLVLLERDNNDFYSNIYQIVGNSTQSYALITSTYNSRNDGIFGVDNNRYFFRGFNVSTNTYDFYIFNFSTFNSPVIKSNVTNNSNYFRNSDGFAANKTSESNNFGITEYNVAMNYIGDGGNDMFDDGNYIDIYISSASNEVSDTNIFYGSSTIGSSYGYYVGSSQFHPHINVAYLTDGTIRWVSKGNVGSDGSGSVTNYSTNYTCTNGRQGTIWANINYGTSDPSIGDIWFTVEKNTWSTNINSFVDNRKNSDTDNYNHYIEVSGQNFMLFKTLLSRTSGQNINESDVLNFVSSYVNDIDLNDSGDFNLINLSSLISWNVANANSYTSIIPNFYNYAYDGGASVPFFTNGKVHIYTDQLSSFSTFLFDNDNKYCSENSIEMNRNASLFKYSNNSEFYFKIITENSSFNISTNLSSVNLSNNNTEPLRNYFYSVLYDNNLNNYFTHIVGNDGNTYHFVSSINYGNYRISGDNLMRQNDSNQYELFYNSTISTTSLTYNITDNPYPDFGSSILFAWRYENSSENILTLNNTYFSTLSIPLFGTYDNYYCYSDFLFLLKENPIEFCAVNVDGSFSTYVHPTSDYMNSYNTYYDNKSFAIRYISGNDGLANYFVYNGDNKTFSLQTENSTFNNSYSNQFINNFYYND